MPASAVWANIALKISKGSSRKRLRFSPNSREFSFLISAAISTSNLVASLGEWVTMYTNKRHFLFPFAKFSVQELRLNRLLGRLCDDKSDRPKRKRSLEPSCRQ